jgi:hypothetical protein
MTLSSNTKVVLAVGGLFSALALIDHFHLTLALLFAALTVIAAVYVEVKDTL